MKRVLLALGLLLTFAVTGMAQTYTYCPMNGSACSWSNNNTFNGTTTVGPGNVSLKPGASDQILYVSPNGNDSNDGFSWGSAKATVGGACSALTGGNSSCTAGTGMIWVSPEYTGTFPSSPATTISILQGSTWQAGELSAPGNVLGGNVALKPLSTAGIMYVMANGSDSNDGLSPGSGKLTIGGACAALPSGNSSCSAGNGNIIIEGPVVAVNSNVTVTSTIGLQIQPGTLLNIASGVTLTIEGALTASQTQQLFEGSGEPIISDGLPISASWFPGGTILAQINDAYAALPSTGGQIVVPANQTTFPVSNDCSNSTTVPCAVIGPSVSPPPLAATYYVTPKGSDSNNGLTWGSAKATISGAQTAMTAGGIIYLGGGAYSSAAVTVGDGTNATILSITPGTTLTLTGTLTLKSESSIVGNGGQVNIVCNISISSPCIQTTGDFATGSYINLTSLSDLIINCNSTGCSNGLSSIGFGIGASLRDVLVENTTGACMSVAPANQFEWTEGLLFQNVDFYQCGADGLDVDMTNGAFFDVVTFTNFHVRAQVGYFMKFTTGTGSTSGINKMVFNNFHGIGTSTMTATDGIYFNAGQANSMASEIFIGGEIEGGNTAQTGYPLNGNTSNAATEVQLYGTTENAWGSSVRTSNVQIITWPSASISTAAFPFGEPIQIGSFGGNNGITIQTNGICGGCYYTQNLSNNNGTLGVVIANGTATMTTAAISSGACGSTVTVAATGVATTDTIAWAFNAAPTSPDGKLTVSAWPTSGNVNFQYCNPTAGSLTPAAATINWRVAR